MGFPKSKFGKLVDRGDLYPHNQRHGMDEDEAVGEPDEGGAGGEEGDGEEGGGDLLGWTGYTPKLCTSGQGKGLSIHENIQKGKSSS